MERQKLLSSSQKYKQALEDQVSYLKENAMKAALQGLIVGGVAVGTWLLVKTLTGKSGKEEKSSQNGHALPAAGGSSFTSGIVASIQAAIASFLLSIAREKIMEVIENYLEKRNAAAGKTP
jgi:hypothetical protein